MVKKTVLNPKCLRPLCSICRDTSRQQWFNTYSTVRIQPQLCIRSGIWFGLLGVVPKYIVTSSGHFPLRLCTTTNLVLVLVLGVYMCPREQDPLVASISVCFSSLCLLWHQFWSALTAPEWRLAEQTADRDYKRVRIRE